MNQDTFLQHFNQHLVELAKVHPKIVFDFQNETKNYKNGYVLCQYIADTYMTALIKRKEDVLYSREQNMYTPSNNNTRYSLSFAFEPFEEGMEDTFFLSINDVQFPTINAPTFSDLMALPTESTLDHDSFLIFIEDEIGNIADYELPEEGIAQFRYEQLFYKSEDGDRFAALSRVVYKDQVVAFVKEAGRAGRDTQDMAIVNIDGYKSLLTKIASYKQISKHLVKTRHDIAFDFTHIYGYNILDDEPS